MKTIFSKGFKKIRTKAIAQSRSQGEIDQILDVLLKEIQITLGQVNEQIANDLDKLTEVLEDGVSYLTATVLKEGDNLNDFFKPNIDYRKITTEERQNYIERELENKKSYFKSIS